jgi:Family of unknown function (DUF6460)
MSPPQIPPLEPPKSDAAPEPGPLTRFFGGRPLAVIFKLALLSILVGFILKVLGLDPFDIIRSIRQLFQAIWDLGFEAFERLWRYFLLGAVLVVPIWLIVRLVRAPRGR